MTNLPLVFHIIPKLHKEKDVFLLLCSSHYFDPQSPAMSTNPYSSDYSIMIDSTCKSLPLNKSRIKLYCLSDLHADAAGCLDWLKSHCIRHDEECVHTVFICAGDVSAEVKVLREVFTHLKANYDDVCFTPGNHDLWRKGSAEQGTGQGAVAKQALATCSFSKLSEVLRCAQSCDVHTGPLELLPPPSSSTHSPQHLPPSVKVLPLFSWYHSSWDTEPNLEHPHFVQAEKLLPFDKKWSDFRMCAWSPAFMTSSLPPTTTVTKEAAELLQISTINNESTDLAKYFASLNEPYLPPLSQQGIITPLTEENDVRGIEAALNLPPSSLPPAPVAPPLHGREDETAGVEAIVVTYSHFLPRQELCPEKKYLLEPHMTKVIGSEFLEAQIRRVKPQLHIFGHTHIPIELALEGIRYVQWPLGYAREKDTSTSEVYRGGPLMVYDSGLLLNKKNEEALSSSLTAGDSAVSMGPTVTAPGFPLHTPCYHSRWSQHYRENCRTSAGTKHRKEEDQEEELSPWLAAKLKGFLEAMA